MHINWDSISHFFQIPLGWFRDVDRRSRLIPEGNLVQVDRNNSDGTVIKLNEDRLQELMNDLYVTLATAQKILGYKTFQNDLAVEPDENGDAHSISVRNASAWSSSTARTAIYGGQLSIETSGTPQIYLRGISNGTSVNLARIYRGASGLLICAYDANGNTLPNGVLLAVAPTDVTNTNSLAIATLGWVNDKFIRKITSGTGVLFSTDGTVSIMGIGTGANQVAAGNHNHEGTYAPVSHTHPEYENGGSGSGSGIALPGGDGVLVKSGTALSANSYLATLAANLDDNGKVPLSSIAEADGNNKLPLSKISEAVNDNNEYKLPLSKIKGDINQHSGTCLVTVDNDGNFGHSGNNAFKVVDALKSLWDSSNGNDQFVNSSNQYDMVLVLPKGATSPQWSQLRAVNPGSNVVNMAGTVPGDATADSSTWGAATNGSPASGTRNGVKVRVQTRTVWDGVNAKLYGFYRDMTYDIYGRLSSVSAETRYTIDTPTVASWS